MFVRPRGAEVHGEPRPAASLLRRGAALAVDLCFSVCGAALALDVLSFLVPLDEERAALPILAVVGALAAYVLWFRDRGASRSGGAPWYGLSPGRRLLRLALVPAAGPRRFVRPVTVTMAEAPGAASETVRTLRAVLLGVAASLVAVFLLGHAVSRTTVFLAVQGYAHDARPFVEERGGGAPRLATIPSSLLIGRSRAYVRVDAEWEGNDSGDSLEFFLERGDGAWQVVETRIGEPAFLRKYALSAPDADVPAP